MSLVILIVSVALILFAGYVLYGMLREPRYSNAPAATLSPVSRLLSGMRSAILFRPSASIVPQLPTGAGDSIERSFYEDLGFAVTQWQCVEKQLCNVYLWCSCCDNFQLASAVFYSASDFLDKLRLTDCAVRAASKPSAPEVVAAWEPLRARLARQSDAFSALTHFTLSFDTRHNKKAADEGMKLTSTYRKSRDLSRAKLPTRPVQFDREDLTDTANAFIALQTELLQFSRSVARPGMPEAG